ncbi:MAG: Na+/H+ antiporter subunit E [Candidatus Tritonobacter lacicola]|nr:Na+/H+ antiporter subunit E [Candidatus Tritonobacter lacicola]
MRSKMVRAALCFLVWLGLTYPPHWESAVVGLAASVFVAALTGSMFIQRPHLLGHPGRYFWFLIYVLVVVWECFKANIEVAFLVAHPKVPIRPGIVKVKTSLRSDTGLTVLANSITLTPGTLTVDVDRENGVLFVHWIKVASGDIEKATQAIVARFERILLKIFE